MQGIRLYLAEGSFDGAVTIDSINSQLIATRVDKSEVAEYENALNGPGIYLLLVDSNSVYVGQTGLDTLSRRIMNKHTGNIDASWHTVLGFKFGGMSISNNELQYIENAMCEYVHDNFAKCLTASPAKSKCNEQYRNKHYNLGPDKIQACKKYISDIKAFIAVFPDSIFPKKYRVGPKSILPENTRLFQYKSKSRDAEGTAEIGVNQGHTNARIAVLKKGSRISAEVAEYLGSNNSILAKRKQLETAGKIKNRVLQEDVVFQSQSGAGQFLIGAAFDGNSNWKTVEGNIPLKELL